MTAPDQNPLPVLKAAEEILDAQEAGEATAVIVPVDGPPELVGWRVVIRRSDDGTLRRIGSFGDHALDEAALALGKSALEDPATNVDGVHELGSLAGESVTVYVEGHHPHPDLVIVGAGHIARPLCAVGSLIGFRVIVIDDRPDFATQDRFPTADRVLRVDFADPFANILIHPSSHVVLVTRGHKYDYECLRHLLRMEVEPRYIGMIGSRRRVRAAFAQLVNEGLSRDRLAMVRAPLGLDIGAETPAEIAVSVAAEIVLLWRGGAGSPLADKERVLDRFF